MGIGYCDATDVRQVVADRPDAHVPGLAQHLEPVRHPGRLQHERHDERRATDG
jgi:hypothetical protein